MRTGDYQGAVTSNARAAKVDREYIAATKTEGMYAAMYYNHNLDFLASAAMMSGQYAEAMKTAGELVTNVMPALAQMTMLEPFAAKKLFVLLRFARWSDVLALPPADPAHPILNTLSHFGRGVAHAALGHVNEAETERASYAAARKTTAPDASWGLNKAAEVLLITDAVLDARIAHARKDAAASIAAWRRAVAAEDALNYDEPPDWFYPTRESLGAALIAAGDFDEADRVFSDDLERNPKNPRSLYGRWQALLMGNKNAEAAEKAFRDSWKHADTTLRLVDF
jgi:tetratricopeptide (TPR) repeat protein